MKLPALYVITGGNPGEPISFLQRLEHCLQQGLSLIQLRCPELNEAELQLLAERAHDLTSRYQATLMVNGSPDILSWSCVDGVHLPSRHMKQPFDAKGKLVAASCHNATELAMAVKLGVDFVTLSPVKTTLSHSDTKPLGWEAFQQLATNVDIPVYALGGLGAEDLPEAKGYGAYGVAAISQLWPSN